MSLEQKTRYLDLTFMKVRSTMWMSLWQLVTGRQCSRKKNRNELQRQPLLREMLGGLSYVMTESCSVVIKLDGLGGEFQEFLIFIINFPASQELSSLDLTA